MLRPSRIASGSVPKTFIRQIVRFETLSRAASSSAVMNSDGMAGLTKGLSVILENG